MNPNETPQSSWWINIDQMLQSLSTSVVTPVVSETSTNSTSTIEQSPNTAPTTPMIEEEIEEKTINMEQSATSQVLEPSFSIESLTKPLPNTTETPTVVQPAQKNIRLSHAAGMMASVFGTLAVIVIGWWVYSVQYPIATEDFINSITGLFNSTTSTTQKNLEPDSLIVTATGEDTMHSAAPEDSYMLDTPLADALLNSQSWAEAPNSTEKMLDNAIGDNNQMTGNSGSIPSSKPVNMSLPTMSMTSAEAKQKLLNLSQSAEEAMTNLVWNSDSKLATMRVIYKNSQAMLTELMANEKALNDKFIEQINSLQSLYDKAIS